MSLAGRALLGIGEAIRGSHRLRMLRTIRSRPRLSTEEALKFQFRSLSSLLAMAEAHVPYYREMFRSLKIRSSDIRNLDDFAALPVLTKEIIRNRRNDLLRKDISRSDLIVGNSGGSTGVPLQFFRDRSLLEAADAGAFRNLLQAGWKPGEMIAFFWGGDKQLYAMSPWRFELRARLLRFYQLDPFHSGPQDMDRWLKKWKSVHPTVALGYASTIARFAAHIEKNGYKIGALRGVFTTAEKLYPAQREIISRVFACHVYDCYGSSEVLNIASECPHGSMHINVDYVVLETESVAISGSSAGPKPFLVTSLTNHVMPFIRYRNEDTGELLQGSCECGNNFPLMRLNVSRISDNFVLPNGEVVHGEFFTHLMYGSEGISMFQFHQLAPDFIRLWIVPGDGTSEGRQKAIRAAVAEIERLDSSARIRVEVRETDAIPLSNLGKHRFTRSDVSGPAVSQDTEGR